MQDAAQQRGYDASFVALALFPDVLNQLASQIDWTTELGTAFLSDSKGVMDAVQRLRAQAQAAGNLKSTPQQVVNTETQGGQPIIVIQPANPQVVYVPVYNPQLVYWPPPPGVILFSFGLGIAIGAMISNNSYYAPYGWGAWGMGWHSHTVVCVGRPWVRAAGCPLSLCSARTGALRRLPPASLCLCADDDQREQNHRQPVGISGVPGRSDPASHSLPTGGPAPGRGAARRCSSARRYAAGRRCAADDESASHAGGDPGATPRPIRHENGGLWLARL